MSNFKIDSNREKLFSDTTELRTPKGKIYFSAVVEANKKLYSLIVSTMNNKILIMKGIKKVGGKSFIQFDNAVFYKNHDMKKLIDLYKGIGSFGLLGDSKSNWPI